MNRNLWITLGVIILILLAGGALFAANRNRDNVSTGFTNTSGTRPSTTITSPNKVASAILETKTDASLGQYLADSNGNALYTYANDQPGVSNCNGDCLTAWPAYTATAATNLPANVTVITRADGTKQYAYKGMPLYSFTSDTSGHVTGDGVSGFHIAKP